MAKLAIKVGSTSQRIFIFVQDSSATTGVGLSGLTNATSGLKWYISREDDGNAGGTSVSPASATLGTFTSGGFKEKDSTNMKGVYELGIPNTALASGSKYSTMMLSGATNMAPVLVEIELVAYDPFDAVHLGLSSLPNTAVTTNGSLITSGTGTDQLIVESGVVDANIVTWLDTAVTAAAAGIPDVNIKNINNIATTSVTTINANQGTTQPVNFTGTAGSALAKVDVIDLLGTAWLTPGTAGTPDVNLITTVRPGIRKNTALNNFEIVMTDSTNHNPATGKTVTVTRSIDNSAFAAGTLGAVTELSNGAYYFNFGAGDLNGDIIMLRATASGCDDLFILIRTNP